MTIGKRISRLRKEKKLSQEYLAEKLDVSRQAVSKWENDLTSPDTNNLVTLAQLLGVSMEYLATGKEQEPQTKVVHVQKSVEPAPMYCLTIVIFILVYFMNTFGLLFGILNQMVTIQLTEYSGICIPIFYDMGWSAPGTIWVALEIILLVFAVMLTVVGKILSKWNSK